MVEKSRKILFIGLNYSPEMSGIAPYSAEMVQGLASIGYSVKVLTTMPHYPEWVRQEGYSQWTIKEHEPNHSVVRLRHYIPRSPKGIRRLLSEISFGLRAASSAWGKPEAVILVSPGLFSSAIALIRAKLFHKRAVVVVWVQDFYTLGLVETGQSNKFVANVTRIVERFVFNKSDHVVAIHSRFKSILENYYQVSSNKVTVVPNWSHVECDLNLDTSEHRKKLGWNRKFVVLHTGNMGVKQGLENVALAAEICELNHPDVLFVLMGNGSEKKYLRTKYSHLQNLQFLDPVTRELYSEIIRSADCLLVNELAGVTEMALPSKLTSYFSAGLPIIAASAKQGITCETVLESRAGIILEPGDPAALVNTILEIKANPSLRMELGKNGIQMLDSLRFSSSFDKFRETLPPIENPS